MPRSLTYLLIAGLGCIFLLMPVHAFFSTWGGTAIGPLWLWKSWKEILLVILVLITIVWLARSPQVLRTLARQPLVICLAAYLLLTLVLTGLYWRTSGADASLAGLAMNLRYLAVGALSYLVFMFGTPSTKWVERAKWFVVCAGITLAVLGILQVLVLPNDALKIFGYGTDTIAPAVLIDDNPDLPRAFATLRGPNDFGAFLILPIMFIFTAMRRLPIWVWVTSLTFLGLALALSGSRSAWLGALVATGVYALLTIGRRLTQTKIAIYSVVAAISIFLVMYVSITVPALRIAVFHSSPGDSSLTEGSTDNHISATADGVGRVINWPVGCGAGCAGPSSFYGPSPRISENYFVQIAEQVGVLGLALFLMIVGIMAMKLYGYHQLSLDSRALLAALVGYGVIGLFLHTWSDDPLTITWWILAGAIVGYNESQRWKKSKSSLRSKTLSSL